MKYPNFFIAGAAKAGTSSLWEYLKENKEVFMPADELYKEPAYFSYAGAWMSLEDYLGLFKGRKKAHRLVGEASGAYLTDPQSARKIYEFNPRSKIIIMLRNPADRAYSLYGWMAQEGYEYAGTFERALKLEEKRIGMKIPNFFEPQYYYNYLYFNSGLYYEQVKRYIDLFGSSVFVIKFDDFKNDFKRTYKRICDFLGIEVNEVVPVVHNESRAIHSPKAQFFLRHLNNRLLGRFFSRSASTKEERDRLLEIGLKGSRPPKMRKETRALLLKKYENDLRLLSKLTGIDFTDWCKAA